MRRAVLSICSGGANQRDARQIDERSSSQRSGGAQRRRNAANQPRGFLRRLN